MVIFAAARGHLDGVNPADASRVNEEIRAALRDEGTILAGIRESRDLPDDVQARLGSFLEGLMKRLVGSPAEAVA